jgi:hypothetical protein
MLYFVNFVYFVLRTYKIGPVLASVFCILVLLMLYILR